MYLVDTNVWLERLLDQERSSEVGQFLASVPARELMISDFGLHSIGVILMRLGEPSALLQLVDDLFLYGGVSLTSVGPHDMRRVVTVAGAYSLDFDDAYQYVAAEQNDAVIVSFDGDFDRTERGRKMPAEVMTGLTS